MKQNFSLDLHSLKWFLLQCLQTSLFMFRALPTLATDVAWSLRLLDLNLSLPLNHNGEVKRLWTSLYFFCGGVGNDLVFHLPESRCFNSTYFFSLHISSIFCALSDKTAKSFNSRAPTIIRMSSFNPHSKKVHIWSVGLYLADWTAFHTLGAWN